MRHHAHLPTFALLALCAATLPARATEAAATPSATPVASASAAADSADALRATVKASEEAFAKAFADRDRERFFSYVHPEAVFMSGRGPLRGKAAVVEAWSAYFKGDKAPFSWRPVVAEAHGDLGATQGPIYDPAGKWVGNFSSVWQRQADGSWKVVFDGAPPCEEMGKAETSAPATKQ